MSSVAGSSARPAARYQFGRFELDTHAKVLFYEGRPVRLARKSVETLIVLVENAERILTKEDLLAAIWPDRVVDEVNLSQHVSILRKAFERNCGKGDYIVTYPGRGYQFVERVEAVEDRRATPSRGRWKGLLERGRIVAFAGAGVALTLASSALFSGWLSRSSPETAVSTAARTPLVRLPGAKFHPAISADGRKVAFAWESDGARGTCIYATDLSSGESRPVPGSCGEPSSPAWAPDGRRLAFLRHSAKLTELVVSDPAKPMPARVVARLFPSRSMVANRMLDWSPDGRWFAVSDKLDADQPFGLHLIASDTGDRRRISDPSSASNPIGDVEPRFSPNGQTIGFVRTISHQWSDLMVVNVGDGRARLLATKLQNVGGLDWTASGEALVFSSKLQRDYRVWRISPATGTGTQAMTADPAGLFADSPIQFSVARALPRLVYTVSSSNSDIWRLTLPRPGAPEPRWERWIATTGEDVAPQYSPDGTKISFVSDRSGEPQLWLASSDGDNPRQLTSGAYRPNVGRWSPDSRQIVFNSHDRKTFVVDSGGGEPRQVVVKPRISLAGFSPDGGRLRGTVPMSGTPALIDAPAGGGESRRLAAGFFAAPCRGGREILFTLNRLSSSLWRMPLGGGSPQLLIEDLFPGQFSYWDCDSRYVYYLSPDEPDGYVIRRYDAERSASETVAGIPGELPPLGASFASLSPDGRYLLATRSESVTSDLVQVEPYR